MLSGLPHIQMASIYKIWSSFTVIKYCQETDVYKTWTLAYYQSFLENVTTHKSLTNGRGTSTDTVTRSQSLCEDLWKCLRVRWQSREWRCVNSKVFLTYKNQEINDWTSIKCSIWWVNYNSTHIDLEKDLYESILIL
jgi:hypothetical protein